MLRDPHSAAGRAAICACALLLLIAPFAVPSLAGDWMGEEVQRDGTLHVMNPATPADGATTVELESMWKLGGETDNEDEFFGVITRLIIDDQGDLYVLDSQLSEIKVYSADGEFLRTIGREGEGPGEFRAAADMFFLENGNIAVLQLFPGRIVTMSKDGEPGDDYSLPTAEGGGFVVLRQGGGAVEGGLILSLGMNTFEDGLFTQTRTISLVNAEGTIVDNLHSEDRKMQFSDNIVFQEEQWDGFDRTWNVGPDGRVFANLGWDDYSIQVWNGDGTVDRVIHREYESHQRSQERIGERQAIFEALTASQVPNAKWKMMEVDKDFENIYPREDGSVWVLTSHGQYEGPEGALGVFDVFDPQGRYVREVTLMGDGDPTADGYFFVKDRVFVVTDILQAAMAAQGASMPTDEDEEDPEPMAIRCYRLDNMKVGMN